MPKLMSITFIKAPANAQKLPQECQQAGDHQGVQEAGTAVAPRQLPVRGREKRSGKEVY